MNNLLQTLSVAASGMRAQAERLRLTSENIANVDTPGYHRKLTAFRGVYNQGTATGEVTTSGVILDRTKPRQVYDPGHPLANKAGYYESSNVNLMIEIADAREAQRSYEANLRMFDQTRQMASSLLNLLRR